METGVKTTLRMHSSTIVVSNQDTALDYYTNTLGWTVGIDNDMGEMRFLTVAPPGGGSEIVLSPPDWYDDGRSPGGHTGISFTTPDIDAFYTELSERGVEFKGPPEMMPWGTKACWFLDPDGNDFFVVAEEE